MRQAEQLLIDAGFMDAWLHRFQPSAEPFRESAGILPIQYRKNA